MIKMGEEIGAATIDLEWVQVHPTGLVKPDDADAKVKFLAAEALRGVGGILIDSQGERFANELGRRDYVTGRMWKNKPPFRLMLNSRASKEIHWHCEHYKGRGVMKYYENCKVLAEEAGFSYETLAKTMATYNGIAAKMNESQKDAQGGAVGAPYEAYGGGMSWDPWGKKFFHNVPVVPEDEFNVAIVTPVIHYCMGGLEIDVHSRVVKKVGQNLVAIDGLYAAGEIAGGVHGNNRLGGNSLLDCVVFGRVAAEDCASYMLGDARTIVDIKEVASRAPKKVVSEPSKTEAAAKKGKLAAYNPEKWQGTARGKFMKWFMARKSRQEAEKAAILAKEAEEAAALEAFEEALVPPVAEDREAEVVDMAYFPIGHQGGGSQWTVFPWFQETRVNPLIQLKNWYMDFWNGQTDVFRRKVYFSSALGGIFCVQVYYHHVLPMASYLQQSS